MQTSEKFDVIVVGAGVLGAFHAYHAAQLGKKVLLIEKDHYPISATVRNFGQVVPSGMSSDWFQYGVYSTELYKTIQSEFDISIRQNGSVYLASDAEEQQLIHELKKRMDERDYPAHLLTTTACLKRWPVLKETYCREGLFFPQEVSTEPNLLIHRLLIYITTKFPTLTYTPGTSALSCEILKGLVCLTTDKKEIFTADNVIICNGNEFKMLFSDLFLKSGIEVSKLHMLRSQPMPEFPLEGNILTGLTIRRYESFEECPSFTSLSTPPALAELKKWGIHILFKKALDGSIILGDSHEYASVDQPEQLGYEINHHINHLMMNEASRIVQIENFRIASSWAGYYAQHPEKDIVEIDIENKIHIRTAIGGKGMTSSAGYAKHSIQKIFPTHPVY